MTHLIQSLPLWLWGLLGLVILFLAREPAHRAVYALARLGHRGLRFIATGIGSAEQRLGERNREVLFAEGRETAERYIKREFERVEQTVQSDLALYPTLHRRLCEQLGRLDEDYVRSAEIAPVPSNWARAIRAVSEIPGKEDPVVADVLDTINQSMRKAESKALESFRESTRERHQLLKRMLPSWRAMLSTLGRINKNVESVIQRAKALDGHMERYEEILQETDKSLHLLSSSSFSRFMAASVVLSIGLAGALVNFQLLAQPMAAVLGSDASLGGFSLADISATVVIFLQITVGFVIMECLQVTRMFPAVGALAETTRRILLGVALVLLLILAVVGANLAFARELIVQQQLLGSEQFWPIPLAQMGLGFVLPLILAFVAIPLEQFIASARTVSGISVGLSMRGITLILRFMAIASLHLGVLINRFYDIVIFLPLWLQAVYLRRKGEGTATVEVPGKAEQPDKKSAASQVNTVEAATQEA
ncbi:hypothetical protein MO867_14845 [Microbulbifer sp. OS29]|uniref:Uncharacterized protein n=1 Tax=Microbulbifer okhotskensis TaxID=2926617 RepID=A0A9X2ENR8_9GAMM|nr:hypothetical protein [Microbulbifer okhotskensis]MCO1335614.1 hypothetical protein [Microbulbifer okhotskensis]